MRHEGSSPLRRRKCKIRWILWRRSGIDSQWEIVLRFHSTCNDSKFSFPCWAATNACLLAHGIQMDYRKTFLAISFLQLVHPGIILKEFTLAQHQENEDQFHKQQGRDSLHKRWQAKWGHNSDADLRKKAVDYEFGDTGGNSAEFHGWTAKTANIGAVLRQIPQSTIFFGLENEIQKSSDYLFWFSIGSNVMD